MLQKFKSVLLSDSAFELSVLVLVAVCAFGLGRLSMDGKPPGSFVTELTGATTAASAGSALAVPSPVPALPASATDEATHGVLAGGMYVASRNGARYHLTTCPGAKQINEENKVYFSSRSEAEAAGYTPASNCPGL